MHLKGDNKEQLKCFSFGDAPPEKLSYLPSIEQEEDDSISKGNKKEVKITAVKVKLDGIEYAYDKSTNKVYDLQSYISKNPIQVGTLEITGKSYKFKKL